MKERKQAQEELASTNHLIEGERKKLEAAQLQLRRLQNKVWHRNGFRLFYICSFLFSFVTAYIYRTVLLFYFAVVTCANMAPIF